MRDAPSAELIELLARLRLATPEQVRAVRRYAHSLAKDLPLFDSVWVDALMRRRLLTPFQAAEINAGRGAELELGPVVLDHPPERFGYANQYLAHVRESGERVRVVVAPLALTSLHAAHAEQLKSIAEQLQRAQQAETARRVLPILQTGVLGNRLWIVQPFQNDISLHEWLLRGGRLPAEQVLEIARQMTAELAALERFSLEHGDISAMSVRIHESGRVSLACLGLRSIVRPGEGYAHADLSPEAYDYLAPERISAGTAANAQSDLYACGCLWWLLLTGRPPLAGGDSLAKIKAAHAARITPLSRLAPETPALLMTVIDRLLQAEPHARGQSFSELAEVLGPASPAMREHLADCYRKLHPWTTTPAVVQATPQRFFNQPSQPKHPLLPSWLPSGWNISWLSRKAAAISAATCGIAMLVLATWFCWPASSSEKPDVLAKLSDPRVDLPGLLAASEIENGASLDEAKDDAPGHHSGRVKVVSNDSTSPELVTTAEHIVSERMEPVHDPARSMKVVRQVLPIRELVLPSDRVVQATSLELHPGMRLAPAAGARARIQVPVGGWQIDVDELRLENIDFILPRASNVESDGQNFVVLKATSAQFHSCTFRVADSDASSPARSSAIHWIGAQRAESIDRLPPAGHLLLANCLLANIHTGVDCQLSGPMVLELDNVLFTAPREAANSGSLWRIDHAPASEDIFVLRMNACTVRDAMSLVDIYCAELPSDPGKMKLETIDCVFSLRSTGALLRMIGPYRPDRLVRSVSWGGRGSLLPIQGRFGLWYDAQGAPHPIDDTGVEIDGLVRGGVEFAGQGSSQPQDSVLTHWAAPLIGDARPGVRVSALPAESRN